MYIELYVDVLFLICLVPELLSLWLLSCLPPEQGNGRHHSQESGRQHSRRDSGWLARRKKRFWRRLLWAGSLSAGLSVAAAVVLRQIGFWGLLAVDIGLQYLTFRLVFGRLSVRRFLELWLLQKLFYLMLGGALQAGWSPRRRSVLFLLSCFVAGGIFFYALIRLIQRKKRLERLLFSVELSWRERSCRCLALLDTGNQLYYGVSPVLLLSPKEAGELGFSWKEAGEAYRLIPYASVGCPSGVLHGFVCDRVAIRPTGEEQPGEEKICEQVIIGVAEHPLSHTGEYQMLLHPALFSL